MPKQGEPRFFYGWIVVVAAFIIVVTAYGMRFGFAVFYIYFLSDFGWTRTDTALALSIAFLVQGLTASGVGYLVDRIGPRRVVAMGAIVLALGMGALSQTSQLWHLYLFFGLFAGLGITLIGNPSFIPIISNWFVRKRGAAVGIYFAGVAGAGTVAPLVEYIITSVGWRQTYLVLAGVVLVVILPLVAFVIRAHPKDKRLFPDGDTETAHLSASLGQATSHTDALIVNREWVNTVWTVPKAIKTPQFWGLFLSAFSAGLYLNMLLLHQVAHVVDLGFSQALAARVLGLVGFASMAGGICGFVSDHIGRERAYTTSSLLVAAALYILISIHDGSQFWLLNVYAIMFGFGMGANAPAMISSISDIFMGKNFGVINGTLIGTFGIGGVIGPLLGGWIFDVFDSYASAFYLAFFLVFVSIAMMWLAAPRRIRLVAGAGQKTKPGAS